MKVVVNIPDSLMDRVREAVEQSEYDDAREFVTMALENQVELELSDDDSSGVMTIEQAIESETEELQPDGYPAITAASTAGSYGPNALNRLEYDQVTTVSSPDHARLDAGPLWGQYNRIFPVKLTLRVLANELRNQAAHATSQVNGSGEEWASLDRFSRETAEIAREYGLKIKKADKNKSRGRGEQLAAALPVGDEPEKSKERFRTHFIGNTDQQGDLTGAAPHLHFVSISPESPELIGITRAGLEFASHWNPLIDSGASSNQPLSEDEAAFYIEHVENQLPRELEAMVLTATAVTDGANRPESLTNHIATLNDDWTESQASTVRSGLVSRMYELGLIQRERVGQRGIAYKLTDDGRSFLNTHNA